MLMNKNVHISLLSLLILIMYMIQCKFHKPKIERNALNEIPLKSHNSAIFFKNKCMQNILDSIAQ